MCGVRDLNPHEPTETSQNSFPTYYYNIGWCRQTALHAEGPSQSRNFYRHIHVYYFLYINNQCHNRVNEQYKL